MRPLRRLDFIDFVRAAPGSIAALHAMPESRVAVDESGAAEVTCDCGALPAKIEPTLSVACTCGRIYVHLGHGDVRGCRPEPGPCEDDA